MLRKLYLIIFMSFISLHYSHAQSLPPGFVPPALNPKGATLKIEPISENVYALISSKPPVDNAGFIVGEEGVLVIDAHINGMMAQQIIDAVRSVTDKPILYLVNTNGHADHTFGNYAFPKETKIITQKLTKVMMSPDMDERKSSNLGMVAGDRSVYTEVRKRMPDLTFNNYMEIDLGGITVELHHFGGGNTYGDTVVYIPSLKTAWTGNLILGEGSLPFLLIGNTVQYRETLNSFRKSLDLEIIVPGHGLKTTSDIFDRYTDYLETLEQAVTNAHNNNLTLEQSLNSISLEDRFAVPVNLSSTNFYKGLHPFNIQKIYLEKKAD